MNAPNLQTHVPVMMENMPAESAELAVGRPDLPTPSLWQRGVKVKRRIDDKEAVILRVDWDTNQFRAFYLDEGDIDPETRRPAGRMSERTEWEQCSEWYPEVTLSPAEKERQRARDELALAIQQLDATELAAVEVLCDDPDPAKGLAKLIALRRLGVIKAAPEVAQAAMVENAAAPKKGR